MKKNYQWKRGEVGWLAYDLDLSKAGDPIIQGGTQFVVEKVRRNGDLWVNIDGFGHRNLKADDVTPYSGNTGKVVYSPHHGVYAEGHIFIDKKGACTITLTGAASMKQRELNALAERMVAGLKGELPLPKVKGLTPKQVAAYLQDPSLCPKCGSDVEGGHVEISNGSASQEVKCTKCSFLWRDVYRLETVMLR